MDLHHHQGTGRHVLNIIFIPSDVSFQREYFSLGIVVYLLCLNCLLFNAYWSMLTLLELKNKSCLDLFFLFLVSSELEWTTLCGCILVVFSFCKLLMGKQLRAYFWRLQNSFQEKIPFFFMGKKTKPKKKLEKSR